MKFCEKCGEPLSDEAVFCENCGAKIENSGVDIQFRKEPKKSRKWIIIVGILFFIIVIGVFVIYPQVNKYIQKKENQKVANEVVNLIKNIETDAITIDSEKELEAAKKKYNSLSDEQKKLVDNYDKLEGAYTELDKLKEKQANQEKAKSVIDAIKAVNPDSLTDTDTSIQEIRTEYERLTEEQKKLVTNLDKLEEYESIVQQKKEVKLAEEEEAKTRESKQQKLLNLFANLGEYKGMWGDFGAHVNEYQGMVESVINSSISLSDYFDGDVDNVYMELRRVIDNDVALIYGANTTNQHYLIRFEGLNPNGVGRYRTLECMVDSVDGVNLVYRQQAYY